MGRWTCLVLTVLALLARQTRAGEMQVHIDPQTGQLVPEPTTSRPAQALPAPPRPAADIPAPGGGMMAVLNGQFMGELVATVNPDGSVRVDCIPRDAHVPRQP